MARHGIKFDLICFSRDRNDWGLYVYDGWRSFPFPKFAKGKSRNTGTPHQDSSLYARGTFEFCMAMRRTYS